MCHFNPRTREGCDQQDYKDMTAAYKISIHAPVKGATTEEDWVNKWLRDFNPRTREGCDEQLADMDDLTIKFQSTHP